MSKTISQDPERVARKETAAEKRAARREALAARVRALQAWRQDKASAAQKRDAIRTKKLRSQPRGVDRVPAAIAGLEVFPERETPKLGTYRGVAAPYATRRAMGQRGHQRKPRRRELPGAVARRLERNQKAWT